MQAQWTNPFAQFLTHVKSVFHTMRPEHDVNSNVSLLPRFVKMSEERRFVFDIFERVEALGAVFDRLHTLSELYVDLGGKRETLISAQRDSAPERTSFEVPDELHREMEQCHVEARALITFTYYELSTLVTLLRDWLAPLPNSQLEYLVGVRNKILAHPRRNGFVKNSATALTIGPILHAHLVGAESWVPLLRDWYIKELKALGGQLADEAGAQANVALLRDRRKRTENFKPEESLQLKSYVIPEPDPLESAREMASLLERAFLSEIERACTQPLE